jgi:hypothetical protein
MGSGGSGDSSKLSSLIDVAVYLETFIYEVYSDASSGNYKQLSKKIIGDLKMNKN